MTLLVGVLALLVLGRQFVNPRLIGSYMLAAVAIFFLADTMVGIWPMLLHALGRDSTLTGRTDIWRQVLDLHTNPLVGVGFESFWLGERLRKIGELYWWQANEAHNGYLETYLNLGLIGLFILVGWIVAAFRKSRLEFLGNFEFSRFRLSYFVAAVIYNWTESGFRSLHPIFFVFFIIAMDYPRRQDEFATDLWEMADSEAEKGTAGSGLMKPSLAEQDATENWPGGCPIIGNRFLRGGSVVVVSFFVALLLTFLATANAATIPAASVSLTDVRAAVNSC